MMYDQGIPSTFPRARSLKELKSIDYDDETFSTPRVSYRRKSEVDDLKISLNRAMLDREPSNNDFLRRPGPGRRTRYDPRRNTTGLTEYEIRLNQTSKL